MVKYTDYQKANDVPIEYVLNICNMYPDRYGRYICPFHSDTNASAYTRKNRLFCFACTNEEGFNGWSNIEIVKQVKNVTKEDAVKIILNLAEGDISPYQKNPTIINEQKRKEDKKKENSDYEDVREAFLIKAREIKDSDKTIFIEYLNKRKINKRVLEVLNSNGVIYGTDSYGQPGFVFNYKHCVFRNNRANQNHSMVITEGAGSYVKLVSNAFPVYYIVEGIYDALTLIDRDTPANVICLNSIKNTDDLIDDMKDDWNNKKVIYILALDNDDVGKKTSKKFEKFFMENNVRYSYYTTLTENPSCKDVNDLRVKDII